METDPDAEDIRHPTDIGSRQNESKEVPQPTERENVIEVMGSLMEAFKWLYRRAKRTMTFLPEDDGKLHQRFARAESLMNELIALNETPLTNEATKSDQGIESEEIDPKELEAIASAGDSSDEFIVRLDFCYFDVQYTGYEILSRGEIGRLAKGLKLDCQIGISNIPGTEYEGFDIGRLLGAFAIHSADPSDIAAMRQVFGDSVGQTSLFERVWEALASAAGTAEKAMSNPEELGFIDLNAARRFLADPNSVNLKSATGISYEAAEALATHHGDLDLGGLTELSLTAAEALARHQGELWLGGLGQLPEAIAQAISRHQGKLVLDYTNLLVDETADTQHSRRQLF